MTGSLSGRGELTGGRIGDNSKDPVVVRSMDRAGEERVVKAGDGNGGESAAPATARCGVHEVSSASLMGFCSDSCSSGASSDSPESISTTSGASG